MKPERVVLGVREGVPPSSKPPVRIFLGTEPAHYRAERIFVWSIEQVRDPSRAYEVYLMKDLTGFNRNWWLTGFTNYRFAIPHFAGAAGRAIWNDVDQIYLADPGELFDTDMDGHGFLAISPGSRTDTGVMLIDCARMAPVWTLEAAQSEGKNSLIAKALGVPGLRGDLAPEWHARDEEYVPSRSKLLHYTILHTQPWRPLPGRFVYQRNPVGYVWFDLERSADISGYHVFGSAHPSIEYTALLARLRAAGVRGDRARVPGQPVPGAETEGLRDLIARTEARTILDYTLGKGGDADDGIASLGGIISKQGGQTVTRYDPVSPSLAERRLDRFDGVVCTEVLEYLPDEDVPWVIEELFGCAHRFVRATVVNYPRTKVLPDGTRLRTRPRDPSWWYAYFQTAGMRHPEVHWQLLLYARTATGREVSHLREGGRWPGGCPAVWVLSDGKPGHANQCVGLADALGWPWEVKELRFTPLSRLSGHLGLDTVSSASLAPPWPDLVIAGGRRTASVARWIRRQSRGRSRLVQLGHKGGDVAERFDAVVIPAYHRFFPHPHRIETLAPLTRVAPERLAKVAERRKNLLGKARHPRLVLLVGGANGRNRLDPGTARRMGEEVRAFAQTSGGSVFAITSSGTGRKAAEALIKGLGESGPLYHWQPGQGETLYLACLGLADAIVVAGGNESMLADAAASGKPVYIYPLPKRQPNLTQRLQEWVAARSQARPLNRRGTVRPQQGLEYLCARLIARGIVHPPCDLNTLHHSLMRLGIARPFGAPLETGNRPALREADEVARKVQALLGVAGPSP